MLIHRRSVIALMFSILATMPALAQGPVLSALEALKQANEKRIVLIDIRTPQEWQQTGIAAPAHKISMHQSGFLQKLNKLIDNDKSKRIALICATGSRSAFIQAELAKRGYTNTYSVAEGMLGGPNGKGWIPRGLPVKK